MSFVSPHPHVMRLSGTSAGADPFDLGTIVVKLVVFFFKKKNISLLQQSLLS